MIAQLEAELNSPPIDWLNLYTTIQAAGVTDPCFHRSKFPRCPVNQIFEMVQAIGQRDQSLANAYSVASANTAYAVFRFMGNDKIELKHLLPFPHLEDKKACKPGLTGDHPQGNAGITKRTAEIFRAGLKSGEIPTRVLGAFYKYMDEIEELTK